MKFLLALIILGMTFLSGCKQCGSAITFSDTCDPEIVSDATPVAPTPPSPGYTLSSSSVNVAENGGTGTYTIVLNTEPTGNVVFDLTSENTEEATLSSSSLTFNTGNWNCQSGGHVDQAPCKARFGPASHLFRSCIMRWTR